MTKASIYLSGRERWGCRHAIHSEVEVDGDEVFRAPDWSAGLLHLHFSVARGVPGEVEVKYSL